MQQNFVSLTAVWVPRVCLIIPNKERSPVLDQNQFAPLTESKPFYITAVHANTLMYFDNYTATIYTGVQVILLFFPD